jgi:hypothetical protein
VSYPSWLICLVDFAGISFSLSLPYSLRQTARYRQRTPSQTEWQATYIKRHRRHRGMSFPSLETTSVSDWRYTAEGGANLVLSYTGPPSAFSGKLLRLRKKKKLPGDVAIPEDVGIVFGEQVITPLLGAARVVKMEKVEIVTDWLREIKRMLSESGVRPKAREDEDEVDEEKGVVVLAEDLVHGEGVLAIEIKVSSSGSCMGGDLQADSVVTAKMGLPSVSDLPLASNSRCQDLLLSILHAHVYEERPQGIRNRPC